MTKLADLVRVSGKTDEQLAREVGCSRSMFTKIRLGTATPSLPLAVKISRAMGVPVEDLLPVPEAKAS